jgi:hypothetical protein
MINILTAQGWLAIGGLAFAAYLAALSALIAHRRRRAFWPVFRLGLVLHADLALRARMVAAHVLLIALALAAAAQAGHGPRAYVGLTRSAQRPYPRVGRPVLAPVTNCGREPPESTQSGPTAGSP